MSIRKRLWKTAKGETREAWIGSKEQFYAINTGVMLRANADDEEASVITGFAAFEAECKANEAA